MSIKKTLGVFVNESKLVHADRYDYSNVDYTNAKTKVCIICPIHGNFYQLPSDHVRGSGCSACGSILINNHRKTRNEITAQKFVGHAVSLHGEKYNYGKVQYHSAHTPVNIGCPKHGDFFQLPYAHLCGHGCPMCGSEASASSIRYTTLQFIEKARIAHNNKYEYDQAVYVSAHTKVKIVCPKHGIFMQVPGKHLQGHGCSVCSRRNYSNKAIRWITSITKTISKNIQHAENGGEYRVPTTRWFVDGFCEETNTIYEFYGDVYHGNPAIFNPDFRCHPYDKSVTAGELYQQTIDREAALTKLGYNVVSIWENCDRTIKRNTKN